MSFIFYLGGSGNGYRADNGGIKGNDRRTDDARRGAIGSRILLCLTFFILIPACSTVNFVQYEQSGSHEPENRWHHTVISGMVEVSKPLNLNEVCKGKAWTKVTTERSFWNILVGLPIPTAGFVVPYVAWTNRVECFHVLNSAAAKPQN